MADEKLIEIYVDNPITTLANGDLFYTSVNNDTVPEDGAISYSDLLTNVETDFDLSNVVSPSTAGNILTSDGTDWISSAPVATSGLPAGYLYNLTLSNNVTDATNDIDIATGKCRDSTDAEDMVLSSALTKRLDAAWAVGTNQGGLDTGSIADTSYHIWLIKRSDTGVVDALFSTSATTPTMPTNYDYKRRIGSIMRASSAIRTFVQFGDQFLWMTPVQSINQTNPGTSAVTGTLTVPAGVRNLAMVSSTVAPSGSATLAYLSSLEQTDTVASNSAFTFGTSSTSIGAYGGYQLIRTNTSSQIRTRLSQSGASTVLYVVTHGYFDTRGKDN